VAKTYTSTMTNMAIRGPRPRSSTPYHGAIKGTSAPPVSTKLGGDWTSFCFSTSPMSSSAPREFRGGREEASGQQVTGFDWSAMISGFANGPGRRTNPATGARPGTLKDFSFEHPEAVGRAEGTSMAVSRRGGRADNTWSSTRRTLLGPAPLQIRSSESRARASSRTARSRRNHCKSLTTAAATLNRGPYPRAVSRGVILRWRNGAFAPWNT